NTHPALWMNGNPNVNLGFTEWSEQIVKEINGSEVENWVLLSNSMNNLYPEVYDFSFVNNINSTKNISLIIDDSHGIELLNKGNSILQDVPKKSNVEIVVVASMTKALGLDAGVILGTKKSISNL